MSNEHFFPTLWDRSKTLFKGFFIGFLILLMLIPGAFISNLVNERSERQQQVVDEITSKWAGTQNIIGPVLTLPYKEYETAKDGKITEYRKVAYFLPDKLMVNGTLVPEVRHRSIFSVTLYKSALTMNGQFNALSLVALKIAPENVLWNEAHVLMGISDMKGLEEDVQITWNGSNQLMESGVPDNKPFEDGLNSPVSMGNGVPATFSVRFNLKGSGHLYFAPVGKMTSVALSAPWKDPAFDGQYLPNQSDVSQQGFAARWKVSPLSSEFPRQWTDAAVDLNKSSFGVKLLQPVDGYTKTQRSTKYAILFTSLTFIFFFFLEIMQKRQVHPLQYILVGLALSIFYTLLLSISEYTGFNVAYLIASIAIVGLISAYVWSIFNNIKTAAAFLFVLSGLYVYIFVLIQSQDYALLLGSIGLFLIIAVIMYYSKKINWHSTQKEIIEPHIISEDELK